MPVVGIKLPSGLEVSFDGSDAAFEGFKKFVKDELPGIIDSLGGSEGGDQAETKVPAQRKRPAPREGALDAREVERRFDQISATTDVERVTVIAHAAVESGLGGADADLANSIYTDLGLSKPGRWPSTFGNAKARGYLKSSADGWQPTSAGENLAVQGTRRTVTKRRARKKSTGSEA